MTLGILYGNGFTCPLVGLGLSPGLGPRLIGAGVSAALLLRVFLGRGSSSDSDDDVYIGVCLDEREPLVLAALFAVEGVIGRLTGLEPDGVGALEFGRLPFDILLTALKDEDALVSSSDFRRLTSDVLRSSSSRSCSLSLFRLERSVPSFEVSSREVGTVSAGRVGGIDFVLDSVFSKTGSLAVALEWDAREPDGFV